MRTGKDIILATKPYAADHAARSWWYIISTTVLLGTAMIGTVWNVHLAARVACSFLAGFLYLRLFVLYHDQQHKATLPHSNLAEGFMRAFGILILSHSSIW